MGTKRKGLPEVWPSGLSKWLSGEQTCGFALWLKAHCRTFDKVPNTFDFARWRVEHTALLTAVRQRYEKDGWKVSVEDQNRFRLKGKIAILSGKPDLVCRRRKETRVVDAKSGTPRDEHAIQVATYMVALPLVWGRPGLYVTGEVAYSTHVVDVGAERAVELQPRIFEALRTIGAKTPLPAVPSPRGCAWCDLAKSECPDRMEDAPEPATETEAF